MGDRVQRSRQEPVREGLSWEERWRGPDNGLITCWEVGREMRSKEPELAEKAMNGELPPMGWKGGVEKKTKKDVKYGTLQYLAQWQGIRGEDLDVSLSEELTLTCARHGIRVMFTGDQLKWCGAQSEE